MHMQTPSEAGRAAGVRYVRVPVAWDSSPSAEALDVLERSLRGVQRGAVLAFACHEGGSRAVQGAVYGMLLARRWLRAVPDEVPALRSSVTLECVMQMTRLLRGGARMRAMVDQLLDEAVELGVHLRHVVQKTVGSERDPSRRRALRQAQRYIQLIVFQSYLESGARSFAAYRDANAEITRHMIGRARAAPEAALAVVPAVSAPDDKDFERQGEMLTADTLLKEDQFLGIQRLKDGGPVLAGAPNFRKVGGYPVYGVGQPTVNGIQAVLRQLDGARRVLWFNMREEPVLMIGGRPFVARRLAAPFGNLEMTGIAPEDLEALETQLQRDVVAEIRRTGGKLLVHVEQKAGELEPVWAEIEERDVLTLRETFDAVRTAGAPVEFFRVPVTDEEPPEYRDVDDLLRPLRQAYRDDQVVPVILANCQMGRGRTTTALVIASLWIDAVAGRSKSDQPRRRRQPSGTGFDVPPLATKAERLASSRYMVVLRLIGMIPSGAAACDLLDAVLDSASAMQHLRNTIYELHAGAEKSDHVETSQLLSRAVLYLRRYLVLLCVSSYLHFSTFNDGEFSTWISERPHILKLIDGVRGPNSLILADPRATLHT